MENSNLTVTEQDQNQQINIAELAETVANAIAAKNAKNEKSIASSNFDKLNDEDREAAYKALKDLKEKEANKVSNKIAQLEKDNADLLKKVQEFETKEKTTMFKNNATQTLSEMGITEKSKISLLMDLAGQSLFDCINDNKEFDGEKAKSLFSDLSTKYEINLETNKKEDAPVIQVGAKKQEQTNTNSTLDQYRRILGIIK